MRAIIVSATREGIQQAAQDGLKFPVMAIPFGASWGTKCRILHSVDGATDDVLRILTEGFSFNPATGLPKIHLISAPVKPAVKDGALVTVVALADEFLYTGG